MLQTLRSVRYAVGNLTVAEQWYSQWLGVQPYQSTGTVLRYCVDGSWLELVEMRTEAAGSVLVHWGVDSLQLELLRLNAAGIQPQTPPVVLDATTRTATFLDPFGNTVGLIEMHDPDAERARAHRAAEKIALRNVRETLDGLSDQDRQQRKANRLVLVLALIVLGLVLGALGLLKALHQKVPEDKILIPLSGKK